MMVKTIVNHLQTVGLAALFPLEWPRAVEKFFAVGDAASASGSSAMSLQCEFSTWQGYDSPFYAEALLTAAIPISAVVLCALFWSLWYFRECKRLRKKGSDDGDGLPDGWTAHMSEQGVTFYHNAAENKSQWEKPDVKIKTCEDAKKAAGNYFIVSVIVLFFMLYITLVKSTWIFRAPISMTSIAI